MEKKTKIFIVLGIFVLIALVVLLYNSYASRDDISSSPNVVLTEFNLPNYLESTDLVGDIPKEGNILIKASDKSFTLTQGNVQEGEHGTPDIVLTTSSQYIYGDSNKLCARLTAAKEKGELSTELKISKTSAAFKYSSLMKYRSCLGF